MIDHFHLPTAQGSAESFYYEGTAAASADNHWFTWQKPRGKSMIDILLVGVGGNGGNGAVGANSTAAGGGGGGSGGQTRVLMPIHFLPDQLFIQLPTVSQGIASSVCIYPNATANNVVAFANGGSHGGNASGATAGTAGGGASAVTAGVMPIGWAFAQVLGGHAGTAGGTVGNGTANTVPTTGILVAGGCGGGGLPASGSNGTYSGYFNGISGTVFSGGSFQDITALSATSRPNDGQPGQRYFPNMLAFIGGNGGGSSHGSATGAGLFGGRGGDGAPGCGGGGGGGCLTGGTAGVGGRGGPAFCLITCW